MSNNDYLTLKNGKKIYCNLGIIGLDPKPEEGEWTISQGYDGGVPYATYSQYWGKGDEEFLDYITKAEMLEICDIMIARWNEFKNYVEQQKDC